MPTFLHVFVERGASGLALVNHRSRRTVATTVETAFDSAARRRGLLGRDGLPDGAALIIAPCNAIHMFFMRFAIDVVFVDRDGRVLAIRRALKPWRVAIALRAFATIELPVGAIDASDTRVGDTITAVEKLQVS
jgi:uncharacterized protein